MAEVERLGRRPRSGELGWAWDEEWRNAACALAAQAGHDPSVLRRAALHDTGDRRQRRAAQLLTEAVRFAWREPIHVSRITLEDRHPPA